MQWQHPVVASAYPAANQWKRGCPSGDVLAVPQSVDGTSHVVLEVAALTHEPRDVGSKTWPAARNPRPGEKLLKSAKVQSFSYV